MHPSTANGWVLRCARYFTVLANRPTIPEECSPIEKSLAPFMIVGKFLQTHPGQGRRVPFVAFPEFIAAVEPAVIVRLRMGQIVGSDPERMISVLRIIAAPDVVDIQRVQHDPQPCLLDMTHLHRHADSLNVARIMPGRYQHRLPDLFPQLSGLDTGEECRPLPVVKNHAGVPLSPDRHVKSFKVIEIHGIRS